MTFNFHAFLVALSISVVGMLIYLCAIIVRYHNWLPLRIAAFVMMLLSTSVFFGIVFGGA